ncbi:helix-turn-helix domain-containing protein [Streptomyces qinzhouensis]|uniref:Helix-turn-helix domain-containing protein n=1 Tax=Streptomyces qinzhouensis TaxID=2599401 RepID=A0A5B8IB88_9ACTN|nr:helix-turn-helix domain-containing protein [Streptomyces qinzhouensis]QDY75328.1 helix-turn-helix domain-containing protein [Streptomyces qinzhouensis]
MRTFSSEDVLPAERFEWWAQFMSRESVAAHYATDHLGDFPAEFGVLDLGSARLVRMAHPAFRARRPLRLIRQSDREMFHLIVAGERPLRMSQRRTESGVFNRSLLLFDTSYAGEMEVTGEQVRSLSIQLPKAALSLPADKVSGLVARPLSYDAGMSTVLVRFLTTLADESVGLTPPETAALERVVVDLVSATVAQHLDVYADLPVETRRQALLARIDAFVDANLRDPQLTPAVIASHHHVSLRTLHELFRERRRTVAATIRHRRLERCREALADPRHERVPVHVVGARYGFTSAASFSRAFRSAYGITAVEFRQRSRETGTPTGPVRAGRV